VYLLVLYASYNNPRLPPYTALSDWSRYGSTPFCQTYELDLYKQNGAPKSGPASLCFAAGGGHFQRKL